MLPKQIFIKTPIALFMFCAALVQARPLSDCLNDARDQVITTAAVHWPDNRQKQKLHAQYWLNAQAIDRLPENVVWLDVRPKATTEAGLLAVGLNQLGNMPVFADKTVVLVGTGFDQRLLDQQILALKRQGLRQVLALSGGIRTWRQLHQQTFADQITPEDFLTGGQTLPWQIITVGLSARQQKLLPETPVRQFAADQTGMQQLQQFLQQQSSGNDFGIDYVVIGADAHTSRLLQRQYTSRPSASVVWLKGGLAHYQQYVRQQANLIRHKDQSLSLPCRLSL